MSVTTEADAPTKTRKSMKDIVLAALVIAVVIGLLVAIAAMLRNLPTKVSYSGTVTHVENVITRFGIGKPISYKMVVLDNRTKVFCDVRKQGCDQITLGETRGFSCEQGDYGNQDCATELIATKP